MGVDVDSIELVGVVVLETEGEIEPNPFTPDNFVIVELRFSLIEDQVYTIMDGLFSEKVCGESKCVDIEGAYEIRMTFTDGLNNFTISIGDSGEVVQIQKDFDAEGSNGFYYLSTTEYKTEVLEIYNAVVLEYERAKISY